MKLFSPTAMLSLSSVFQNIRAVHEHTSWGTDDLTGTAALLGQLGHEVVFEVPNVAIFLKQSNGGETRIELVRENVTQHEAWAVETQAEWLELERRFEEKYPEYTFVPNEFKFDHLWAKMYRHAEGGVVQIIWRKQQVYQGLFPETKE